MNYKGLILNVRMIGLEPTRRKAPDPKSGMATNYITSATSGRLSPTRFFEVAAKVQLFFKKYQANPHENKYSKANK